MANQTEFKIVGGGGGSSVFTAGGGGSVFQLPTEEKKDERESLFNEHFSLDERIWWMMGCDEEGIAEEERERLIEELRAGILMIESKIKFLQK